jgi:hypothetical protein
MYQYDLLFQVAQMRRKELQQISESERSARAARKEQANKGNHSSWFAAWLRGRAFGGDQTGKTSGWKVTNMNLPYLDEISSPRVDTCKKSLG